MNKDIKYIEEAYETILEKSSKNCCNTSCEDCEDCDDCKADKEKKLSSKQKKIAQAAPPPDKITGADFAALKKKKVKEGLTFNELYRAVIGEASKEMDFSPSLISGPFAKSKRAFEVFKDLDGNRIEDDADYLVMKLDGTSDELLGRDVLALDPFEIDFIQKSGVED